MKITPQTAGLAPPVQKLVWDSLTGRLGQESGDRAGRGGVWMIEVMRSGLPRQQGLVSFFDNNPQL